MMMQRLGVSDRNSYPWSTPIWGHQFGMLPSTPTPVKEKSSKKEEALKEEEELHDCEADGNGKGKKPKKKINPKKINPKKNIPTLIGCMDLKQKKTKVKVNPRKTMLSHFEPWQKENQRVNLFL